MLDGMVLPRMVLAKRIAAASIASLALVGLAGAAKADRIVNKTAVFEGLDKITGRIITFDVAIGETVQFGTLTVTPRACYTRPPTEPPQTDTFVEIDEVNAANQYKQIFGGWMFASSPGLHALEHPIYDVWLTDCKGGDPVKNLVRTTPEIVDAAPAPIAAGLTPPVPPPPKPGTVPRLKRQQAQRQQAQPDGEDFTNLPGGPQLGGQSSRITSQPLPPPVSPPSSNDFLPPNVTAPATDN